MESPHFTPLGQERREAREAVQGQLQRTVEERDRLQAALAEREAADARRRLEAQQTGEPRQARQGQAAERAAVAADAAIGSSSAAAGDLSADQPRPGEQAKQVTGA